MLLLYVWLALIPLPLSPLRQEKREGERCLLRPYGSPAFLVLGSWLLVLGSWFLVLGSWFLVLGSWFLALGSLFLVLGSWFLVLGSWFLVLGSRFSVLGSLFFVLSSPCYNRSMTGTDSNTLLQRNRELFILNHIAETLN